MQVIELRDYLIRDGMTGAFIRYFEEHFLFSQRETGMHVLGQFEVVDAPNRFIWIRGFEDMATRRRGLEGFYGGPFWQARRTEANSMIVDSDAVHLLRPLGSAATLTGGLSLEDRALRAAGRRAVHTGLVVVEFHRAPSLARSTTWSRCFEQRVRPALLAQGHQLLGHFVAERAPNDYPRLPVIQDPALLLILSAYRDAAHWAAMRAGWPDGDPWRAVLEGSSGPPLAGPVTTTGLRPDRAVPDPLPKREPR